jgi:tetratricopeptide (TPR) repeat protein
MSNAPAFPRSSTNSLGASLRRSLEGVPRAASPPPPPPPPNPQDLLTERKVNLLCHEANQCLRRGKLPLALETLTLALSYRPDSYKALRMRAFTHVLLEDYDAALEDARAMVAKDPDTADGFYFQGLAHYGRREFRDSSSSFLAGLRLNPGDPVLEGRFFDSLTLVSQNRARLAQPPPAAASTSRAGAAASAKSKSVRESNASKWLDSR